MRRYSFQDTVLVVNGVEITGWAEGDDTIQIKRRNDSISDKVGASGDMMVSISADKSGEIVIKLQQTSSSNKFLNNLMQLQEAAGSSFQKCEVLFKDTYRQDIGSATDGYIKKPADMIRGMAGSNTEWTFVVERLDMLLGDVDGGVFGN